MRWLVAVAFGLALVACVRNPAGSRCELVCRAELRCAETLEMTDVSYASCVEACTELERDSATQKLVEEHMRCVGNATSCGAVMECQ